MQEQTVDSCLGPRPILQPRGDVRSGLGFWALQSPRIGTRAETAPIPRVVPAALALSRLSAPAFRGQAGYWTACQKRKKKAVINFLIVPWRMCLLHRHYKYTPSRQPENPVT